MHFLLSADRSSCRFLTWTVFYVTLALFGFAVEACARRVQAQSKSKSQDRQQSQVPPAKLLPAFDFTAEDFTDFTARYLNIEERRRVRDQAVEFLQLSAQVLEQQRREPYLSLLVDKRHALPADYVPQDLVALENYPALNLTRGGLQLRRIVIADLLAMNTVARSEGVNLPLGSTYRSFGYQRDVFRRYAELDGVNAANRYSAKPGESQHQLGLVIDFAPISQSFATTAAGRWLAAHALDYGFSLSYPEGQAEFTGYIYEPWHYRYVGKPIAKLLAQYFGFSQHKFFLFWQQAGPELLRHYYRGQNEVKEG